MNRNWALIQTNWALIATVIVVATVLFAPGLHRPDEITNSTLERVSELVAALEG